MRLLKNKILKILGVICVIYYIALIVYGGQVSFSKFWLLIGGSLIFYVVFDSKFNYKIPKVNSVIKYVLYIMILTWLISFIFIEGLIIKHGVNQEIKETDYLLILGAGLKGEKMSQTLRYRMYKSLEYIGKYPNVKIIVSGGRGSGESISEAEAMKRFLVSNGVEEKNIIKEDKSTNTYENLKYTKKMLDKSSKKSSLKISMVTTNFHMYRAQFLADKAGVESYAVPAKMHFILIPNYYVREYFAVINSCLLNQLI
ncbi:YdcF family protein [Clostridium sp. MB40-C1]|uniref:YdcF family protein n=1 Tax=Clostridium sp. MB40-C1 TaxID=3070996 RepID=UPI0027E17BCB|nr:YdcF family protein [Clostridium sp. MB40-C1]WMJ80813.1 YdcF family protein [Clostridium sp. MB40-C1]